jgi:N-acetylneuraminate synthase
MSQVYIIAEAGVNHNGSKEIAFQLIDAAKKAGADAVKFQTFKADNIVTKFAEKASYQKKTTASEKSQFDMLKKLELKYETFHELFDYCNKNGIEFLSTAFDLESLSFLVNDLRLKTLKIPSGEITNGPLLLEHAYTECNLILSTGMSTLVEIEDALSILAFGFINGNSSKINPSREAFQEAFLLEEGKRMLKERVTLLHCTTEYPAPMNEINLNAMLTMSNIFDLKVGYSDHSEGISVPTAATAIGAILIEKHFTLDKSLPGPDHSASLEPDELREMVDAIRAVELAMGNGKKQPMPSELKNRDIVRKSLVADQNIKKGEVFNEENLAIKRPGNGVNPMSYWDYLGKTSTKHIYPDQPL